MESTLVVDIGNTSSSVAVATPGRISSVQRTDSAVPQAAFDSIPTRAVIASVKPRVNACWEKFLQARGVDEILWVDHTLNFGIPITYPKPETVGADRLANACEAAATVGRPVVVCDFGTALTFDVVKQNEGYVGGIICPGLPVMFDYLTDKTERLPRIEPIQPQQVIGKSTEEAMQIGAFWGYLGMVKEIWAELEKELGPEMRLCATGGFAERVVRGMHRPVPVDPLLTLKGLARIAALN